MSDLSNNIFAFDNIIGNQTTIKYFKNLYKNNSIAHAYILDGYEKTGKEVIAKELSRLLLCQNHGAIKNCNCSSCMGILNDSNPDFFIIKSKKSSISVDDIREQILKNLETKPFKFKYKIFIIKNAETMTIQAQNALLKTIEEPPNFAIFILLSRNYQDFLPTILSRCMLFKIECLNQKQIFNYLIQNGLEKEKAMLFTNYSQGSLGKALELSRLSGFLEFKQSIIEDMYKLHETENLNISYVYTLVEKYEKLKNNNSSKISKSNKSSKNSKNSKNSNDKDKFIADITDILDIYLLVYRDSLILKQSKDLKYVIQKDVIELLEKLSLFSVLSLATKIDALLDAKNQLEKNANFNMVMECLFVKISEN
ncbi:MAG: hypothetical protein R3Y29_05620 [bacterium]